MIRLLQGQVINKEERALTLLVNGVGYYVLVPQDILASAEDEMVLHIHTHVREDDISLYGFRSKKELSFFELLLTINGVGPKMALAILNEPAQQLQNAIYVGNIKALTQISGVGKKIAERIILELKSKVVPQEGISEAESFAQKDLDEDVISALESLGYKRHHIKKVLSEVEEELVDTEETIRIFLQRV